MLATLPHHVSSWAEIEVLMGRFACFLRAWTAARGMLSWEVGGLVLVADGHCLCDGIRLIVIV
jgi:hypothetical protein